MVLIILLSTHGPLVSMCAGVKVRTYTVFLVNRFYRSLVISKVELMAMKGFCDDGLLILQT